MLHGDNDEAMIKAMVDLWVNFATYHNPTPLDANGNLIGLSLVNKPWKTVQDVLKEKDRRDVSIYVSLKEGSISQEKNEEFEKRMHFWNRVGRS